MQEIVRHLADDQLESYALWLQAFVASRHGNDEQARKNANQAIAVARRIDDQFIAAFSTVILAIAALRSGQAGTAHEMLAPVRVSLASGPTSLVGSLTLPLWSCDIEALVALGRLEEAQPVLEHLLQCARRAQNPNAIAIGHRCRALMFGASHDVATAIDHLNAALVHHRQRRLPLEVGRTLLEKGTLERRAKRKSTAKRTLEQAISVLEPLGAAPLLARARDELARIGLRRAAPSDGLTPVQDRVAELAAAGMSNREIASTLYMSLRTVETHLTTVYRAVGVRSRAQLIAKMTREPSHR